MLEVTSLIVKNLTRFQTPHQIDPHFQHPDSIIKTPLHHFWHDFCL